VIQASTGVTKNQRGRKALIVLSDGVDVGSEATLAAAVEAAQRADTLVYSILFSDPDAYGIPLGSILRTRSIPIPLSSPDGAGALMRLAKETGGAFFEVSKKLGIDQIFDLIQEELRSQFSIGYVSDLPVRISEFRKIQLAARQKGLITRTRDKYWAQR
jgi:VWFA-related protein